jgi:hypothetical protein
MKFITNGLSYVQEKNYFTWSHINGGLRPSGL